MQNQIYLGPNVKKQVIHKPEGWFNDSVVLVLYVCVSVCHTLPFFICKEPLIVIQLS